MLSRMQDSKGSFIVADAIHGIKFKDITHPYDKNDMTVFKVNSHYGHQLPDQDSLIINVIMNNVWEVNDEFNNRIVVKRDFDNHSAIITYRK
jgi:hypothetical protein